MRSLTYMGLGLAAILSFYLYRFTVWAAAAGGYWNLLTGHRSATSPMAGKVDSAIERAVDSANSVADKKGKSGVSCG